MLKKYLVIFSLSSAHRIFNRDMQPSVFSCYKYSSSAFLYLQFCTLTSFRLVSNSDTSWLKQLIFFLLTFIYFFENLIEKVVILYFIYSHLLCSSITSNFSDQCFNFILNNLTYFKSCNSIELNFPNPDSLS